jgi:hypothetical protein
MKAEQTCEERIDEHLAYRLAELQRVWDAHTGTSDPEGEFDEESIYDYGLAFDYVAPGTFGDDQTEGYWRYQLSWGGPSDEFRFFYDDGARRPYRIAYRFMDWYDGASRDVTENDLLRALWDWFDDCGSVAVTRAKALEEV